MPCRDFNDGLELQELRQRLDEVTQLFCALCKEVDDDFGLDRITSNLAVVAWWKEHKEFDEQERAQEIENLEASIEAIQKEMETAQGDLSVLMARLRELEK